MRFLALLALLIVSPAWGQAVVVPSCGTLNLKPGTSHNVTVDLTGASCRLGGGGGGGPPPGGPCQEAKDYLARTVNGDEGGNGPIVETLICALVADGVWAKLDALWLGAQQNETDAALNLKENTYPLTPALGPPTQFTPYEGFGNLYSNPMYTGFVPPASQFTQDSASIGVWTIGVVPSPSVIFGSGISGGQSHIYEYFTDGNLYTRVNSASTPGVPAPQQDGFYVGDRSSSTTVTPYFNGTSQGPQTSASEPPHASQFTFGGTGWLVAGIAGGSLGDAGNLALYNHLAAYMAAIPPFVSSKPGFKPPLEVNPQRKSKK